jgi:hypothetical protein
MAAAETVDRKNPQIRICGLNPTMIKEILTERELNVATRNQNWQHPITDFKYFGRKNHK